MSGQRALFQQHAFQPPLVIFEQLGGAQIARNRDRVATQAQRSRSAELARNRAQQPVGKILEIVHPVGEQRIVDLAHAHAGALLDPLDRCLGGEAGIDRLVDAPLPALVVGEHLVGLEHFVMLAADAEFGLAGHAVDLFAHLVEGEEHALALGLGVVSHDMFDGDAGLVIDGDAAGEALHQLQPGEPLRPAEHCWKPGTVLIDQAGVLDQFGEHHGHGLQRLDLDLFIAPWFNVLDAQHPRGALAPDDRHTGERMVFVLAGFRTVREIGVGRGLVEVQRFDIAGNQADQPFADRHAGDVHRALFQPAGGEQFEHALAKQVYRANLAIEAGADYFHHAVELGLRGGARGHDFVQLPKDGAGS